MIAPLYDSEAHSARVYAAKIDEGYNLKNEWMMVVRHRSQYATFYSLEPPSLPMSGFVFPDDDLYTTIRFVVQFSDLAEQLEGEDQGPCIVFPTFREGLDERWHKIGEIMVEREQLIGLIRTVGVFAPRGDEEWTERVVLSVPEIEEQDITEAKADKNMSMKHKSVGPAVLDNVTGYPLGRIDIATF